MSFGSRIKSLTGVDTTDSTIKGYINDWLAEGAKELINILPNDCLWNVTTNTNLTSSAGSSLTNCKIVDGQRTFNGFDYACRKESGSARGRLKANSGYMEEASKPDPAFYNLNGKLYIEPDPSSTEGGKISYVSFPTATLGESTYTGFPDEIEHLVVLYASIKAAEYQLQNDQDTEVRAPVIQTLKDDYKLGLQAFLGGGNEG